jgi:hypothetical protein
LGSPIQASQSSRQKCGYYKAIVVGNFTIDNHERLTWFHQTQREEFVVFATQYSLGLADGLHYAISKIAEFAVFLYYMPPSLVGQTNRNTISRN